MNYFPEPYTRSKNKIKVELDLSIYATKYDLNIKQVLIHQNLLKANLQSLKPNIDKLDIDKLKTTYVDLSKLTNVVKTEVFKKAVYDKVVKKVNATDISGLVKKQIKIIR